MKACLFHGVQDVRLEEVPRPQVGPGDLLLKVRAAGICHSDIRVYLGQKKARPGVIPGHETAGAVAEVGERVQGFRVGDRVVVCPILACGRCYFCRRGFRNRCPERTTLGYEEDGGLAEYMLVPARLLELGHVFKAPAGLSWEVAALTEPSACVLNSVEACRLDAGGSLAIVGAGPMGLLHTLMARSLGLAQVIAVEPLEERRAYARRFGATAAIDPQDDQVHEAVLEATSGLGVDAAVVTTGRTEAVGLALGLVRKQGVVNLFGGFPPDTHMDVDPNVVHYSEVSLTGSQNATPEQYQRALHLLTVLPQPERLNTHRFNINEGPEAYSSRLGMEGLKSVVVFADAGS
ncbi:MAG: alcohol dehydrogenase catalytic domain-containing protein [Dehalococcoidia bacterium]